MYTHSLRARDSAAARAVPRTSEIILFNFHKSMKICSWYGVENYRRLT